MSRDAARRVAWTVAGISVLTTVAEMIVPAVLARGTHASATGGMIASLVPLGLTVLGALVISNQPGNTIGWMFTWIGLAVSFQFVADLYVSASVKDHVYLPGAAYGAWYMSMVGGPVLFSAFAFLLLLVPNGRPLSRRWRSVLWLAGIATAGTAIGAALAPGRLNNIDYHIRNPIGVQAEWVNALLTVSFVALLLSLVAGAVSLVLRFRRSRGDERQQLKLVVWASVLAALLLLTGPLFWFDAIPTAVANVLWPVAFFLAVIIIPTSVGAAMLRYRLYDVDLLINRTLVYGSLTVTLGLVYVGGVIALQTITRVLTGQTSDLAIAIVTLAVAALFNPWRYRLQRFIDRRFYRHKYDASRTLAALSTRLRDEVDLDQMAGDLTGVIQDTMQPASVALWLRPGGGP